MGKKSGSGSGKNRPDHISESGPGFGMEKIGSGMEKIGFGIRDGKNRIRDQ
jgi:hypothetical protein